MDPISIPPEYDAYLRPIRENEFPEWDTGGLPYAVFSCDGKPRIFCITIESGVALASGMGAKVCILTSEWEKGGVH
jgi:hypothetical protein